MTLSGTKTFRLDVADYIEEAFERCGLEVTTGYDFRTAKRSLNLLLAEWANRGLNQWTIARTEIPLSAGQREYSLGEDTIDILSAVLRRDNTDYSIDRVSRDADLNVPNKSTTGRPSQFFVSRSINPVVKLWPTPQNSTDVLIFDRLVRMDDAGGGSNTVEMPFRFFPALAAGLAYYISLKRAPQRTELLKALYEDEMERAMSEDRDRASLRIEPYIGYYRG
jgi:hypothetical protein